MSCLAGLASVGLPLIECVVSAKPVYASELRAALQDHTLSCGADAAFYLDKTGTRLLTAGYGIDRGTGIQESDTPLDSRALRTDIGRLLEVTVPATTGTAQLRFEATSNTALGKVLGGGVRLYVDQHSTGDDCVVKRGRNAFVEARFNSIREGLCGNDPLDTCIVALEKSCGSWPDATCVQRTKPALDRINASYRSSGKAR